jgi:hypothetical protein
MNETVYVCDTCGEPATNGARPGGKEPVRDGMVCCDVLAGLVFAWMDSTSKDN